MSFKNFRMEPDFESDPFAERSPPAIRKHLNLLGGRIRFDSNSRELMRLVEVAYQGLPQHRLSPKPPDLRVTLQLGGTAAMSDPLRGRPASRRREPPPIALTVGAGLLGGFTDSSNFVIVSPGEHAARVVVSPKMLRFGYHTRYELIEFAVFALAARAQRLIPVHAACVGLGGRGILLMGESGAGKSTLALLCALAGFDFVSEDSVFIAPRTMLATGVANFLHIRANSLRWLGRSREAAKIRKSPVIRRRSGVKKFEVNLRQDPFRLAQSPLRVAGVIFLSAQSAGTGPLLKPLAASEVRDRLATSQAYGASRPQWGNFSSKLSRLDAFELCRARHPAEAIEALRSLLARK